MADNVFLKVVVDATQASNELEKLRQKFATVAAELSRLGDKQGASSFATKAKQDLAALGKLQQAMQGLETRLRSLRELQAKGLSKVPLELSSKGFQIPETGERVAPLKAGQEFDRAQLAAEIENTKRLLGLASTKFTERLAEPYRSPQVQDAMRAMFARLKGEAEKGTAAQAAEAKRLMAIYETLAARLKALVGLQPGMTWAEVPKELRRKQGEFEETGIGAGRGPRVVSPEARSAAILQTIGALSGVEAQLNVQAGQWQASAAAAAEAERVKQAAIAATEAQLANEAAAAEKAAQVEAAAAEKRAQAAEKAAQVEAAAAAKAEQARRAALVSQVQASRAQAIREMAPTAQVQTGFKAEFADLDTQVLKAAAAFRELKDAQNASTLEALRGKYASQIQVSIPIVDALIQRLTNLRSVQARLQAGLPSPTVSLGAIPLAGLQEIRGPLTQTGVAEEISRAQAELNDLATRQRSTLDQFATSVANYSSAQLTAAQLLKGVESERYQLALKAAQINRDAAVGALVQARRDVINTQLDEAAERLAEIRQLMLAELPPGTAQKLDRDLTKSTQDRIAAQNELERAMGQLYGAEQNLSKLPVVEQHAAIEKAVNRVTDARLRLANAVRQGLRPGASEKEALRQTSLLEEEAALRGATKTLGDQLVDLGGPVDLQKMFPGATELIDQWAQADDAFQRTSARLESIDAQQRAAVATAQSATVVETERAAAVKKVADLENQRVAAVQDYNQATVRRNQAVRELQAAIPEIAALGVPPLPPRGPMTRIGAMEKAFVGAFDDLGRRFQMTLQFAFSGAIIFAAQRFVTEFFKTAIQVERAFADIGTAFQFDLQEEGVFRGTVEFDRRVEGIRRGILALAQEFNVLPTEANKAAFVMVARFADSENALKALRAQLLATKISTIDQAEILRALTATAEAFASRQLIMNDSMTLQERVMLREETAVKLYSKALDNAVLIQQKYGIEVEDTLEGTARAAETFVQMGFSLEETNALISATARQLGQTGVQSAERLVRSIGQLSSAQIRDQLLDLAAASDELTLGWSDFDTGREAFLALQREFIRLDQSASPAAASVREGILQIVGQRRELEAVAAALGSVDLQKTMVRDLENASGAAEERFSFLQVTISERLASIASGFQELAQNFERLGGLTAFKFLVASIDEAVKAINSLLKFVEDLIASLANIPIIGELIDPEAIKQIVVAMLSFRLLMASLSAASLALGVVGKNVGRAASLPSRTILSRPVGGGFVQRGSGLIVPGGAEAAASTVSAAAAAAANNNLALASTNVVASLKGFGATTKAAGFSAQGMVQAINQVVLALYLFTTTLSKETLRLAAGALGRTIGAIPGVGPKILAQSKAWGNAFLAVIPKFKLAAAGAATAVIALGYAIEFLITSSQRDRQGLRESALIRQDAARLASAEGARLGLSPLEIDKKAIENAIDAQAGREVSVGLTDGIINWFSSPFKIAFDKEFRARFRKASSNVSDISIGDWIQAFTVPFASEDALDKIREAVDRATPKTEGFLQNEMDNLVREAGEKTLAVILEMVGGIENLSRNEAMAVRRLRARLSQAKPEDRAQIVADIEDLYQTFANRIEQDSLAFELSIKVIQQKLQLAKLNVRFKGAKNLGFLDFGDIDRLSFAKDIAALIATVQEGIREFEEKRDLGDPDEMIKYLELREILGTLIDERLSAEQEALDNAIRRLQAQGRSEAVVLGAQLRGLQRLLTEARRLGDLPKVAEIIDKITETYRNIIENIFSGIEAALSGRVSRAVTIDEQIAAKQALLNGLKSEFASASEDRQRELQQEIANLENDILGLQRDRAERLAEVTVRLGAAPLNDIAAAQATIAGIRQKIANLKTLPGANIELQEAEQELREATAALIQAQFQQISAFALSAVGVRDELGRLQVELSLAQRNLEIVAQAYGKTSQQFAEATTSVNDAIRAVQDANLEMAILNAKLGSDITNPFEQALIAYEEAVLKLKAPDLGDLDRRRAELELFQADMEKTKAFFDDRLFQLQYMVDTGQLGEGGYLNALKQLQAQTDTTTRQGQEIWQQIQGLIEGLVNDTQNLAFNIPTEIRIPTLFEVRRALAADQMGVNYQDNRQMDIRVEVSDQLTLDAVLQSIDNAFSLDTRRNAPGNFRLAIGGF